MATSKLLSKYMFLFLLIIKKTNPNRLMNSKNQVFLTPSQGNY